MGAALKASGWHLVGSALVVALVAALVFGLWYPYPYQSLAGGLELFGLLVGVDLICGPLLTMVLFNPRKSHNELFRDVGLVVMIQLAALTYGLWSVMAARPVFLVFEVDRYRVVSAVDVDPGSLPEAIPSLRYLGYGGPRVIAAHVERQGGAEFLHSLDLSLKGLEPALRPGSWRDYGEFKSAVLARARPLVELQALNTEHLAVIAAAVAETGISATQLGYLPVQGRNDLPWVALIAMDDARVVGFVPVNGF